MNIGLIAHDSKKKLMQNFCIAYRGILNRNELYATETTGRLVEEVTNLTVHKFLSGRLGGAQQIASMVDMNQIDMLIFLRDPDTMLQGERESMMILKQCDLNNIPFATNLATAELMIKALERGDLSCREMYK